MHELSSLAIYGRYLSGWGMGVNSAVASCRHGGPDVINVNAVHILTTPVVSPSLMNKKRNRRGLLDVLYSNTYMQYIETSDPRTLRRCLLTREQSTPLRREWHQLPRGNADSAKIRIPAGLLPAPCAYLARPPTAPKPTRPARPTRHAGTTNVTAQT